MIYKRVLTIAGMFVFAGLTLGQPAQPHQCTQSDASGMFGFTLTGWLPNGTSVPVVITADARRIVTEAETRIITLHAKRVRTDQLSSRQYRLPPSDSEAGLAG